MSEHSTSEREKIALYLDHVDAIEDVCSAFDDAWEDYSEQWGTRLARAVIDDTNVESSQPGGRYPEVRVPRTDGDDERWILRANGGDWQHVFKYGWYRHEKDRELLTDRAEDSNDLRIGFYHRMEDNRETAVREKVLKFNFRNMGSNPSEFSNIYAAKFNDRIDSIDDLLAETNGTLTGNKLTLIEGTYPIPVNEHDDFFHAYTASLHNAFADLIVQRPMLIRTLENVFEQSLDEFH